MFHFVFGLKPQTEPFHLAFYLCIESCHRLNSPEAIFFYYHHEPFGRYWELARRRVTPVRVDPHPFVRDFRYRDRTLNRYRYAHHADFLRLERLLECGGVYADIDTLFVNPFHGSLWEQPFVLGRENDIVPPGASRPQRSLCNALIMAEPQAEFGRKWLAAMTDAFDGTWSNHSTLLPQRLSEEHPELIHVEPTTTFYKHPCTRQGIRTLLEELDDDFTNVVSMHLWSHLWWSRARRDFSSFHADRLTERYVKRLDTTYTLVAQRFLPAAMSMKDRAAWRLHEIGRRLVQGGR